jgi:outer membrane beta-barrel protein
MLSASSALPAWAQDFEEGGKLYAVQNRKYLANHEFSLAVGVVPMDAFYKGVTGTFSYTYHFDDFWAWEIASATYSLNIETSLRRELQDNFGVRPTEFPELNFFVGSNLVIKPLYGKMVYLNDSLIYGELFITAGPTVAQYENAGVFIGLNAGLGLRVYLSKSFSIRLDVRDYQFISASELFSDTNNELFIQAGVGLNIR